MSEYTDIATKLFDLQMSFDAAKNEVEEAIMKVCGIVWDDEKNEFNVKFSHFTFDDYDSSFEIKEVEEGWEIPKSAYSVLAEMGFERAWVCYNKPNEPRREKSYGFSK